MRSAMNDLRYPLGPFSYDPAAGEVGRRRAIDTIARLPAALRDALAGLDDRRLDMPYREGGWTVRQVVHHLVDSHVNAYIRLRLALTEDNPIIRPYDEVAWADLPDAREEAVELSLGLLERLHERWVALLRRLPAAAFDRRWRHPESGEHSLDELVQMYAWHGSHHVAHVTNLRAREGW